MFCPREADRTSDREGSAAPQEGIGSHPSVSHSLVNELNVAWLQENVGQLIGEAAHLEANGETFAIPREVWADATEKQEAARSESSTEILLDEWFAETTMTPMAYITAADLEHLSTIAQWRGNNATRSATMKRLRFRKESPYLGGKKVRVWFRGPEMLPKHIEREAVRYMVGTDNTGRPKVTISMPAGGGTSETPRC
jgi:hypothetical protein